MILWQHENIFIIIINYHNITVFKCHHHHHHVRVADEGRSVILAPQRVAFLHQSAGEQLESFRTRSSHSVRWAAGTTLPVVTAETTKSCIDLAAEGQMSWDSRRAVRYDQRLLYVGGQFVRPAEGTKTCSGQFRVCDVYALMLANL